MFKFINKKQGVSLLLSLVVLLFLFVGDTSARSSLSLPAWGVIKPYKPGQDTSLQLYIKNTQRTGTYYRLTIRYFGDWWGWGSGPARSVYGHQIGVFCQWNTGCVEEWSGYIPRFKYADRIVIPFTTNKNWSGRYQGAVLINGYVGRQPVSLSIEARTK